MMRDSRKPGYVGKMRPCPKCDIGSISSKNKSGMCQKCYRKWYIAQPERNAWFAEYARGWRARNQHRKIELNRKSYYKKEYGISPQVFDDILNLQGGRCAICCETIKSKPHLDHDHETGKIRQILCIGCNTMLGRVERVGVHIVAEYIRRHKEHARQLSPLMAQAA